MRRFATLDLFSGVAGFTLGLEASGAFRTVAMCESDPRRRAFLQEAFPGVPIYDDVRTLTGERIHADGLVPIAAIAGGFPCQDVALPGSGLGIDGPRSRLWWDMHRIVAEARPRWVFIENSPALRSRGLDRVLGALAALGYDAEWHCIPAAAVGAPHLRDRIWVVAADARSERLPLGPWVQPNWPRALAAASPHRQWADLRDVGVLVHGFPGRVDQIRGLGDAVVPAIPQVLGLCVAFAEGLIA